MAINLVNYEDKVKEAVKAHISNMTDIKSFVTSFAGHVASTAARLN